MKPVKVLVLLLLASLHVFTVSTSENELGANSTSATTTSIQSNPTPTTAAQANATAANVPTTNSVPTSGDLKATNTVSHNRTAEHSLSTEATVSPTGASKLHPNLNTSVSQQPNQTLVSTVAPSQGNVTTIKNVQGPPAPTKAPLNSGPSVQTNENHTSPSTATDNRLWWLMLLAVGAVVGVAIYCKFKSKKVHDHTETIDTGTENASFQNRPEGSKDGVMLLGVKSSGGEENAAAR